MPSGPRVVPILHNCTQQPWLVCWNKRIPGREGRKDRGEKGETDRSRNTSRRMQSCLKSDHLKQNIFKQFLRSTYIYSTSLWEGKRTKSHSAERNTGHGEIHRFGYNYEVKARIPVFWHSITYLPTWLCCILTFSFLYSLKINVSQIQIPMIPRQTILNS